MSDQQIQMRREILEIPQAAERLAGERERHLRNVTETL